MIGLLTLLMLATVPAEQEADDVNVVVAQEQAPVTSAADFSQCLRENDADTARRILTARTMEDFEGAMNLATTICPFEGTMQLAELNTAMMEEFPEFAVKEDEAAN